jgi:hypothetical protein
VHGITIAQIFPKEGDSSKTADIITKPPVAEPTIETDADIFEETEPTIDAASINMASPTDNLSPQSADLVPGLKRKRLPRALLACESCRSRKLRVLLPQIIDPLTVHLLIYRRSAINCRPVQIAPVRPDPVSCKRDYELTLLFRTIFGVPLQVFRHTSSQWCWQTSKRVCSGLSGKRSGERHQETKYLCNSRPN